MKKKLLAILLTVCMVLSMAPAALAADSVFTDVNAGDWFAEEVKYVYDSGLMNGVGDNTFNPSGTVTRGMVWTTLARQDGVDTAGSDPWWLAGQKWAVATAVSDGTNPMNNITRQELVTMLYRYAQLKGYDVSANASILAYADAADVSSWAVVAMQWGVGAGIINGNDGNLNPQGNASRAELATMLYRFVEEVVEAEAKPEPEPTTPVVPSYPSYPSYPIIPPHSHSYTYTPNNDGTHNTDCTCMEPVTESCTYEEGVCSKCGFVENSAAKIGGVYYASAQDALDAATDGDTIELFAGNHGDLVFRVNEDSELVDNAYYYMSNYNSSYYGKENWQYAKRTINGLTITGSEGAVINSFTTSDARDDNGNAKGTRNNLFEISNLKISGITTANGIHFNTSDVQVAKSETDTTLLPHLKLDGLTIENCKTTTDGDTTQSGGRSLLGIANTGANSNAKNITVTGCTVTNMFQGVYVVDGENVRVEGNSFSGLAHNSIHINKHCSGTITISGNTIDNVKDRPIRFSGVQSGTVTISNNTITNSEGDNGEMIKASSMADGVSVTLSGNTWNGYTDEELGYANGVWHLPVVVTTAAEAQAALDNATSGTVIQLVEGVDYGTLLVRPVLGAAHTQSDDWFTGNYRTELARTIENVTIVYITTMIRINLK